LWLEVLLGRESTTTNEEEEEGRWWGTARKDVMD
jgi:hypothetical protein